MITHLADPAALDLPELRVDGEAYQHLFRARRVAVGEEMRVVDGKGRARWARVARVDRTSATVTLGEPAPANEPGFKLTLLVPTCRPERASWLVEKATEVGVAAIQFLNMARAPRELGTGTYDRLRRVAMAAVEQCHRSLLPEVTGPYAFRDAIRLASGSRWFLDPESGAASAGLDPAATSGALLIGPEGGLDSGERRDLLEAGWTPVGLGDRILRLETAAVVGAAMILIPSLGLPASGIQNPKSQIPN